MYGHIATATGWDWSQIDQLTLWHVNELFDYWQDHPPTHVLVAAYLLGGNKSGSGKDRRAGAKTQFSELTQAALTAGGTAHNKLPGIYRNGR